MPRLHIGNWFNSVVNFLLDHVQWLFDAIKWLLQNVTQGVQDVVTYPPTGVMIAIFVLLAWWLRGPGLAVFTAIAFMLVDSIQQWTNTMDTLALVLVATVAAVLIALPVGVLCARNSKTSAVVRPILDFLQTMPAFVYLLPALAFFGIGLVPGVVATVVFAVAPGVRLTELGIRQVDSETVEAGEAFGASPWQILTGIQIPLALKTIMTGVNQIIMLTLSMVVIAGFVGAGGLGNVVYQGLSQLNYGVGFEGGIAVVLLAVYLDRITGALGDRLPARARKLAHRAARGPLVNLRLRPVGAVAGVAALALAGSLVTATGGGSTKADMTLKESSTAAMLSQLKKSTADKQPVVVTLWHPHWAYERYPLKDLKDPKGAFGKPEQLHVLAHKGFSDKFGQAAGWMRKFTFSDSDLQSLENDINSAGSGHEKQAVQKWLAQPANAKTAAGFTNNAQSSIGAGKTIKIGYINWDEDVALTNLWQVLLQKAGYTVKLTELDVGPLYSGLARGDLDLFFDAWLPTTHKTYWDKYQDQLENLGVWDKNASLALAVPTYEKDINSIGDLAKHAGTFHNEIIGIEPGAGEMAKIKDSVMPAYNLGGS